MDEPLPPHDTTPPTAPGSLAATGGLQQVGLSWTAATDDVGVARYAVHRSTSAGFTPSEANRIGQPIGTSYTDIGLPAGTYYYRVTARDAAGNVGPASGEASATATVDTTAPTIEVDPLGSVVSGPVTVTATGDDDQGLVGVQFKLNGQNLGAEDRTSPYSVPWDTRGEVNGTHVLSAVARDGAANSTTSAPAPVTVEQQRSSRRRASSSRTASTKAPERSSPTRPATTRRGRSRPEPGQAAATAAQFRSTASRAESNRRRSVSSTGTRSRTRRGSLSRAPRGTSESSGRGWPASPVAR